MNPELMKIILSKIPQSLLIQIALGPLIDLYQCYKAMEQHRKFELRYGINILVILLGVIIGIAAPLVSAEYVKFLHSAVSPTNGNSFLTVAFSAWLFSYPTSGLFQFLSGCYLLYRYGDTQFFLTEERKLRLAKICNVKPEKIQSIFNYLLSNMRDGKVVIHASSGSLENVLDIFMYGSNLKVREYYNNHIGFFEAYLLQHGQNSIIDNLPEINRLAQLYGVTPEDIKEVLKYCADRIYADKESIANRKEDYAEIIAKILNGDITAFLIQQRLAIQQRSDIELLKQRNQEYIDQLNELIKLRQSKTTSTPVATIASYYMEYDEIKEHEKLATELWKQHLDPSADPIENISDDEIRELIKYLTNTVEQTQEELNRIPTISTTTLEKFHIQEQHYMQEPSPGMYFQLDMHKPAPMPENEQHQTRRLSIPQFR